jgi:hypothetical protein
VCYELGFYIPEDEFFIDTAVETSYLTNISIIDFFVLCVGLPISGQYGKDKKSCRVAVALCLSEEIPDGVGGRSHAVAQGVSRRLLTATARFRVVANKAALGQVFSYYFDFLCQTFH